MPRSSAAERRAHHGPTLTERKKSNTRPKRDMVELGWVFWPLSSLYCSTAFQFAKCVTVVHLPRFGDVARVADQSSERTQHRYHARGHPFFLENCFAYPATATSSVE